jgi:hypothetical protein
MSQEQIASAILAKAAQDVRLLLAHVAREGKPVEAPEVTKLVGYADKVKEGLTPQEEGEFWALYSDLIKRAEPARVDSLYLSDYALAIGLTGQEVEASAKATDGLHKHQIAIKRMRRISLAAFSATLVFLAYLSITESLIGRDVELGREYQLLRENIVAGTTIEDTANKIRANAVKPPAKQEPAPPNEAGGSAEETGPPAAPAKPAATLDAAILNGIISARKIEILGLVSNNDSFLRCFQFRLISCLFGPRNVGNGSSATSVSAYDVALVSAQKNMNSILSNFLLPTITAILGVTVFLLRTASTRIEELSFRSNDADVYWHRLVLGVVGGIAISWFTATDKSGLLTSITPAALAFLIGYSVEILYNILDAMVKALGGSPKQ